MTESAIIYINQIGLHAEIKYLYRQYEGKPYFKRHGEIVPGPIPEDIAMLAFKAAQAADENRKVTIDDIIEYLTSLEYPYRMGQGGKSNYKYMEVPVIRENTTYLYYIELNSNQLSWNYVSYDWNNESNNPIETMLMKLGTYT